MSNLAEYFRELRSNPAHHLGLGDIRLTIGQQEEIAAMTTPPPEWRSAAEPPDDFRTVIGSFPMPHGAARVWVCHFFDAHWCDNDGNFLLHGTAPTHWREMPAPPTI